MSSNRMAYQLVKYILITMLSLMIFCTTLAIILVCLASLVNSNGLNGRSLDNFVRPNQTGIAISLLIMSIVFLFGLIGTIKSHFPSVLIFACMDSFLVVITFSGSYSTHGANMAAFVMFLLTTALSFAYASILWDRHRFTKRNALIRYVNSDEDNNNYYYCDHANVNPAVNSSPPPFSDSHEHHHHHHHSDQSEFRWTVESAYHSNQLMGTKYSV